MDTQMACTGLQGEVKGEHRVAGNNPESRFSCLTSKVFVKWQRVAGTKTYKQVEKRARTRSRTRCIERPGQGRMARGCLTRRVMMIGVLVGMLQVKQLHL